MARTLTSTIRLLDAIRLFQGDFRVRLRFTVNDTTPFDSGVRELLDAAGVGALVPWDEAASTPHDLVLAASENIDFARVAAHTIVLPHGLGFNKFVPAADGGPARLAGLPPAEVLRDGRATVVLSHPDQREQLQAACPASAGRTVVIGDPLFDRMLASSSLRQRYRTVLGTADRTLVLVASTWRPSSALGSSRSLLARLLGQLPADAYQVCAALHPNVWAWYGPAQIRLWLASELDSGLVLLPPENGWQAALIAADQVITDHGSLGLFAAALDLPILLVGATGETVPNTPVADLARRAPRLGHERALRPQLDECRSGHRSGEFAGIVERLFAHVGEATDRLRALVYTHLSLNPPPGRAAILRIPDPDVRSAAAVSSFAVRTAVAVDGSLRVVRYPAHTWEHGPGDTPHHLVCEESESDLRLRERAAALTNAAVPSSISVAARWARTALAKNPGARLAVARTPQDFVGVLRGGQQVKVVTSCDDVNLVASALYSCVLEANLSDHTMTVCTGSTTTTLDIVVMTRTPHEGGF